MSTRNVNFVENEYYHIYNRGNDKRIIFHDKQDYYYFISLLYISNSINNFNLYDLKRQENFEVFNIDTYAPIVSIGAYVLMPNHFHILLTQKIDNGISKFMQKLSTSYVMYYNKKYNRTGSLFEGKFKSQHLDTDRYLKYIFSYIHLNPIKLIDKNWKEQGIKDIQNSMSFLDNYNYSSYKDYLNGFERKESKILNKTDFPNYFPSKKVFDKEILGWLKYKDSALGKT
jgi:putative transposase